VKGTHALRVCVGMGSLVAHRQKKDTPRLVRAKKVSGGAERDKITFLVKALLGGERKFYWVVAGSVVYAEIPLTSLRFFAFARTSSPGQVVGGAGGHPPIAPAQRAARDSQSCRRELLFA